MEFQYNSYFSKTKLWFQIITDIRQTRKIKKPKKVCLWLSILDKVTLHAINSTIFISKLN